MKKIAFLVEDNFLNIHVGVRNYFFALYLVLRGQYHVDFVEINNGFYKKVFVDTDFLISNGFNCDQYIASSSVELSKHFLNDKFFKKETLPSNERAFYQVIGDDFSKERYDAVFITNAWMVDDAVKKITARKLIGLVHDTIPIEYYFSKKEHPSLSNFAYLHSNGFEFFNKKCNFIVFSSQKGSDYYNILYNKTEGVKDKCIAMPPMTSGIFYNFPIQNQVTKKSILLATPFEARKGIRVIPKILNKVKDVDQLLIYGDINRADPQEIKNFFEAINPSIPILWYKKITAKTLINLFGKSRVLLYCSSDEGLGLPIIESQLCGCKVICVDKEPMASLLVQKNQYHVDLNNLDKTANDVSDFLTKDYDKSDFIEKSRAFFSQKECFATIKKIFE